MMSKEAAAMREQMASAPRPDGLTLDEMRAMCEMFGALAGDPPPFRHEAARGGEWVIPERASDGVLLYLHGGGYLMGSLGMYRRFVAHLAHALGVRAFSVDYRLAPEHPFPAAIEDTTAAFRTLVRDGTPADRIVVAGDSAGGSLALSMVLKLRADGDPLPAAIVALSPWADLTLSGDSYRTRAGVDPFAAPDAGRQTVELYLAGADPRDPLASPVFADLTGFPPMLVQIGDHEVLLDDARTLVRRAQDAGVDVTLEVWDEMHHVFQLAAGTIPEADDAIAHIAAWLDSRSDQQQPGRRA